DGLHGGDGPEALCRRHRTGVGCRRLCVGWSRGERRGDEHRRRREISKHELQCDAPARRYCASVICTPSGATLKFSPHVVLVRWITTPFWFFNAVAPMPPATVASALAAV